MPEAPSERERVSLMPQGRHRNEETEPPRGWTRSRVARLIRLITELKTNPHQTPAQLCRTLGISRARYFEDKALLEEAFGFRCRFDRAKGCYEIRDEPYLPVVNLQLSEAFAMIMAVRQLSASGDYLLTSYALDGVRKLVAAAQPALRDFLQTALEDMVLQEGFGCRPEILEALQKACAEHQHLRLQYHHARNDQVRWYTIDPYQLFFKRRALYLDAYVIDEQALRVFRVNRIRKVQFTGVRGVLVPDYSFAARFRDTFSAFPSSGTDVTTVRIRFSQRVARYIQESLWHGSQKITPLKEGGILFEVTVSYPKEVAWWALQWGGDAEVLEPPELRAYVAGEIRKMAAHYAPLPALKDEGQQARPEETPS